MVVEVGSSQFSERRRVGDGERKIAVKKALTTLAPHPPLPLSLRELGQSDSLVR